MTSNNYCEQKSLGKIEHDDGHENYMDINDRYNDKFERYNVLESLRSISGIKFSTREIDVLACIVSGRSSKLIASLLSISVATVSTHIRNIAKKIGNTFSSRNQIRYFIEQSNKFNLIKIHYSNLLVKEKFENQIEKIITLMKDELTHKISQYNLFIFHFKQGNEKNTFLYKSENYFSSTCVKTLIKIWAKVKSKNFLKQKLASKENFGVLYYIDKKTLSKFTKNTSGELTDIFENIKQLEENKMPSIILVENEEIYLKLKDILSGKNDLAINFSQIKVVNLAKHKNYYFLFFEILSQIMPIDINNHIKDFKNFYNDLFCYKDIAELSKNAQNKISLRQQNHLAANNLRTWFYEIKNIMSKKRTSFKKIIVGSVIISMLLLLMFNNSNMLSTDNKQKRVKIDNASHEHGNKQHNLNKQKYATWNLPYLIEHYTPRANLTNTVWNKLKQQKNRNTTQIVGLYGLGGVGKTTLATEIILNPKISYDFRGWFGAESKDQLTSAYFELGNANHLFSQNMSEKVKIKVVREWLNNKKNVLLVYDNVPNMNFLEEYLPNNAHVIITSRNYKVPGALEVDVMKEKESLQLLNTLIANKLKKHTSYENEAKQLIKTLGNIPLALSQAGFYINTNMISIPQYLELYATNRKKLLIENSLPAGDKHDPVYVTWDINIDLIKRHPNGSKAIDLLNFISYCYPENISKKLLIQYLFGEISHETEIAYNRILQLLREYSLVNLAPNSVSIHRLVHDWVKIKHNKKTKLAILQKGINAIKTIYPNNNMLTGGHYRTTEDIELINNLIPHIDFILQQAQFLDKHAQTVDLLFILGEGYITLGYLDKAQSVFLRTLEISKKYFGPHHINTARALAELSGCIGYSKQSTRKYLQYLEESLKILKNHYSSNYVEIAKNTQTLGYMYLDEGYPKKAMRLFEENHDFIKKHLNSDPITLAFCFRSLGIGYLYTGSYTKAKSYLEKALEISKKHLGDNHFVTSNNYCDYGILHILLGNYTKAKELIEHSIAIRKKNTAFVHTEMWRKQYLSWSYFYLGDYKKAKLLLEECLAQSIKGPNFSRRGMNLRNLGWLYVYLGEHNKGKQMVEESLNFAINKFGANNAYTARSSATLGNIHRILGNHKESKKLLENSLNLMRKFYKFDNVNIAAVLGNLGLVYGDLGDYDAKREYLTKALNIFKKYLPKDHIYIKTTLDELQQKEKMEAKKNRKNPKILGYFIIV